MTAVLGTAHILRTILHSESGSVSRWFKRSVRENRSVTRDSNIIIIIIIIIKKSGQ
jgi:hypothetical protein